MMRVGSILCFLLMLSICLPSLAQKTKARTATTQKSQSSQKAQKSQKNRKSAKTQSSQKTKSSQKTQKTTKKSQKSQPSEKAKLQAEKAQLQKNIAANKKQKAELEKKVKQQLEDVLILGNEITEKKRVIDTIRVGIDSLDTQLIALNRQLKSLQGELKERQDRYAQSVRYVHRNNKMQSKMMFIFSAKNINQMYRRTRFISDYATYQRAQGEAVKQKKMQVEQKHAEINAKKQEKADLLERGEKEQKNLEEQQTRKEAMAKELQKQQQTVTALIAKQQKEEADLDRQIDKLIAEEIAREKERIEAEKKRKAEAEKRRSEREKRLAEARAREQKAKEEVRTAKTKQEKDEASKRAKTAEKERKTAEKEVEQEKKRSPLDPKSTAYTSADPDAKLSGSFASNKGRLPMPITGAYQVVRGFGSNVVDGARGVHLSSKGIYLKGQPGAQARCVFDGEVSKIYATGAAYIVMVRHGRYISVYSDLASVSVTTGQKVKTNQTLGKLGPTNIMQFQLRNWTELLNPRSWLRK